jgi:tetratricopeptide (TPR) repeat protein
MCLAKFYHAAGIYFYNAGLDLSQARLYFQRAVELSKLCGDTFGQCSIFTGIALLEWRVGDYRTSQIHATEAQKLAKLSANLFEEARALWVGAISSTAIGDFRGSMDKLHRAQEIISLCSLSRGAIGYSIKDSQTENHLRKTEYAQAKSIYCDMIQTSADQNAESHAYALLNIALIDIRIGGDTKDVHKNLNKAQDIFISSKYLNGITYCTMVRADAELREQMFYFATAKFLECLDLARGTDNEVESFCFERLADIGAWPTSEQQSKWPVIYLGHAYKSNDKLALHKALLFLGDVFLANKDADAAANTYIVALEGFTYMDVHCGRAQCMVRLGDLAYGQGQTSEAINFWQAARPLFTQSSQGKDVAQIDLKLCIAVSSV